MNNEKNHLLYKKVYITENMEGKETAIVWGEKKEIKILK